MAIDYSADRTFTENSIHDTFATTTNHATNNSLASTTATEPTEQTRKDNSEATSKNRRADNEAGLVSKGPSGTGGRRSP